MSYSLCNSNWSHGLGLLCVFFLLLFTSLPVHAISSFQLLTKAQNLPAYDVYEKQMQELVMHLQREYLFRPRRSDPAADPVLLRHFQALTESYAQLLDQLQVRSLFRQDHGLNLFITQNELARQRRKSIPHTPASEALLEVFEEALRMHQADYLEHSKATRFRADLVAQSVAAVVFFAWIGQHLDSGSALEMGGHWLLASFMATTLYALLDYSELGLKMQSSQLRDWQKKFVDQVVSHTEIGLSKCRLAL